MNNYDFLILSASEFERLTRDLLQKHLGCYIESFTSGRDGGIDLRYANVKDSANIIQCKRYNASPVTEPEINQFLGAMNKNKADYGVFITNGRFTNSARQAAREGSPITLIDGNDLVRLVIKYELYITPVKTYVLEAFYNSEE